MGRINKLDANVFNVLAAGEVVERPSSVVKELIENSIDAGADDISVLIERGGLRKISVADNGIGILPDDVEAAFLPHATSKIKDIDDLYSLSTLGFRGEALASIASVSEITACSAASDELAVKLILSGGKIVSRGYQSRTRGTTITVENLFFNTPARLKFIKNDSIEQRHVADTVRMLALANPGITFTLTSEESGVLLAHSAGSLKDAIGDVYGVKVADEMLEVASESGRIRVNGYISKPELTKPNRTYQTTIVNGRIISDETIRTAVEKAYGDSLMKRAYPLYVLDVVLPFDDVDANVHPQKTEVRFSDKHSVFSAVYHAVQNALDAADKLSDGVLTFSTKESANEPSEALEEDVRTKAHISLHGNPIAPKKEPPKNFSFYDYTSEDFVPISTERSSKLQYVLKESGACSFEAPVFTEEDGFFDGKIIGQAFATYIIVEKGEDLYFIDQHAAHERILYDKIIDKFDAEYAQPMLIPYKLELNGKEEEYFEMIAPKLVNFGFKFSKKGDARFITAVPQPIVNINFTSFFNELFENLADDSELTLAGLMKESLCQRACKAAIKGGETLTKAQIASVLKHYLDEKGMLPKKCPHGRPVVIAISKTELEKMFKRIV